MDLKASQSTSNRFLKFASKESKQNTKKVIGKLNRSSDVIILDESFERLCIDVPKNVQLSPKICSPILINDSSEISQDYNSPGCEGAKKPSKSGNVSLNSTKENVLSPKDTRESRPSIGGWSAAQNITCTTPRHETVPFSPRDVANESLEHCSIKKIQQSHKKLLSELYGENLRTLPSLFKFAPNNPNNLNSVSIKLHFNDDDSDKENIRHDLKRNRELYLTGSERKLMRKDDLCDTDKKSKKKLYTEKIPNTPEPKPLKTTKIGNSTTKKTKGKTITEMVNERINKLNNELDTLTKKVKNDTVTPTNVVVERLSFLGSLAGTVELINYS